MFNKTIFKQTLKSNWILWAIFTGIMSLMAVMIIATFDPKAFSGMIDMAKDMNLSGAMTEKMNEMTTLLGMLGQSFYGMLAAILPLIFIIITANSLIANQVDRGSMAYTLSTPIKRNKVVGTQAVYMVSSVLCMFIVVTIIGLASVQTFHGGIFTKPHTADIKAVTTILDKSANEIDDDLSVILNSTEAIKEGAKSRGIDEDIYTLYLQLKIADNAYIAAANILDADADEVRNNPAMIKDNADALATAAKVMGLESDIYRNTVLDVAIAQKEIASSDQSKDMQKNFINGINAAADVLNKDSTDLITDLGSIKNHEKALTAAAEAAKLVPAEAFPEGTPDTVIAEQNKAAFLAIIDGQLANDELIADKGIEFDITDFLLLNLGAFLLMFAISAISFMFSCIFNLSKNSLAFGAGIPVAFYLLKVLGQISDSLESFRYATLYTLYDTASITNGGNFIVQFTVLGILGIVMYAIGIRVFKEKDLPL